jgi:hypothetical protein
MQTDRLLDFAFREAPLLSCSDEHIRTFAVFGLSTALAEFGVGNFEADAVIKWYWQQAPSWARRGSQEEFNRYARARVSDRVGYTRRKADASFAIDRLFDAAKDFGVTFDEIVDSISFLVKPTVMPSVVENGDSALIDLTKRSDSPKILKVDATFLPTLRKLYPVEREDDVVLKRVPVGTIVREVPLRWLAFWHQHPQVGLAELKTAIETRSADSLDLRTSNLFSRWQADADRKAVVGWWSGPPECEAAGGRTFILRESNGGRG